jgi:hypothetical protein
MVYARKSGVRGDARYVASGGMTSLQDIDESALWDRMRRESSAPAMGHDDDDEPADACPDSWPMPGILGSTGIETSFGRVPAHLLRAGDMVRTRDGGFVRAVRVTDIKLDEGFLASRPQAAPVIIPRDAFGANQPVRDVELSPAHPVFSGSGGARGAGVPALQLSTRRGTIDADLGVLIYVQVHLSQPAQINCDGIWVGAATL